MYTQATFCGLCRLAESICQALVDAVKPGNMYVLMHSFRKRSCTSVKGYSGTYKIFTTLQMFYKLFCALIFEFQCILYV